MTTDSCASFETAIERHTEGAASPEESAALTAHLASCAACRGYAESAALVHRQMVDVAARLARGETDWATLEAGIHQAITRRLRRFYSLLGIGALAVIVCVFGFGEALIADVSMIAVVATVLSVRFVMVASETRALKLAHGEELFAAHRQALATRIRSLRGLRWIALAVVIGALALGAFLPDIALRARLTYVVLAGIVGGVWGHNLVVELPRLRRELDALGGAAQ